MSVSVLLRDLCFFHHNNIPSRTARALLPSLLYHSWAVAAGLDSVWGRYGTCTRLCRPTVGRQATGLGQSSRVGESARGISLSRGVSLAVLQREVERAVDSVPCGYGRTGRRGPHRGFACGREAWRGAAGGGQGSLRACRRGNGLVGQPREVSRGVGSVQGRYGRPDLAELRGGGAHLRRAVCGRVGG